MIAEVSKFVEDSFGHEGWKLVLRSPRGQGGPRKLRTPPVPNPTALDTAHVGIVVGSQPSEGEANRYAGPGDQG
jgi:hypothetical protein